MTPPNADPTLDPCGCCEAGPDEPVTTNRPGLPAIRYRRDTHPTVFAAMRARLHRWTVPDGDGEGTRPLSELSTRATDDPSMALLDSWAVVTDVLTFYQERIANEGYLRTATERRSVLELARSIGYELRPGVAASAWVAFQVEEADGAPTRATIPAGTPIQSLPTKDGELPQSFEVGAALEARRSWNALRPRLFRAQALAPTSTAALLDGVGLGIRKGDVVVLQIPGSGGFTGTPAAVQRVQESREEGRTRIFFAGGGSVATAGDPTTSSAVLDPDQPLLPLTAANVRSHIHEQRWSEAELQAFLTLQEWGEETVLAHVGAFRDEELNPGGQQLHALREAVGVFGHNAIRQEMLPDTDATRGNPYPNSWDGTNARTVWRDSQGSLHTDADLYLERQVTELTEGGWVVLERRASGGGTTRVARLLNEVNHGSRTDYAMSGKVTGLTFPSGSSKSTAFLTRSTTVRIRSEQLSLAPVPVQDAILAGTAVLELDTMATGLVKGQRVVLKGEDPEAPGVEHREVLTLDEITHARGRTTLTFLETQGTEHAYIRDTLTLNANVLLATHGETVAAEVLGGGDGARAHQRFALRKPPLTHVSAANPRGAESTLLVRVNGVEWTELPSLYGTGPGDRVYTVRLDDDGESTVIFGDGRSGARLPTGQENVVASYRSGIGMDGQVGAGTLSLLPRRPFGVKKVENPLAASGAADPEALDDARQNAPLTVLTLDRIVSLEDYEHFARGYAGIGKARATAVWDGTREHIHLTVAASDGGEVVPPLFDNLLEAIEGARDPLRPVILEPHQPFVFFVKAKVLKDAAYVWDDVRGALEAALLEAFGFKARGFGEPVTAAEILRVMHGVSGVVAVDLDEMYRTAPGSGASGPLFNAVLDSRAARWDRAQQTILPAQLVLVHPLGIELSEMTP